MAFMTGSGLDVTTLLTSLSSFLVGAGWTAHRNIVSQVGDGSMNGRLLQVSHPDAGFFGVAIDTRVNTSVGGRSPRLYIFQSDNIDLSSTNFQDQPGSTWTSSNSTSTGAGIVNASTTGLNGTFTNYWFFAETSYCYVVIEINPGEFAHFGFGTLNKNGAYGGGFFAYGTSWQYPLASQTFNAHSSRGYIFDWQQIGRTAVIHNKSGFIKADAYAYTNEILTPAFSSSTTSSVFVMPSVNYDRGLYRHPYLNYYLAAPNIINGVSPFIPSEVVAQFRRTQCAMIGSLTNFKFLNITNISPAQVITLGGDSWYVFPQKRKTSSQTSLQGEVNSWYYGVAIRRVN